MWGSVINHSWYGTSLYLWVFGDSMNLAYQSLVWWGGGCAKKKVVQCAITPGHHMD